MIGGYKFPTPDRWVQRECETAKAIQSAPFMALNLQTCGQTNPLMPFAPRTSSLALLENHRRRSSSMAWGPRNEAKVIMPNALGDTTDSSV